MIINADTNLPKCFFPFKISWLIINILCCRLFTMISISRIATAVRCHCHCGRLPVLRVNSKVPVMQTARRNNSTLVERIRDIPPHNYFMLVFPCISLYLGIWQIKRRKWKISLIDELDRKQRM